MYQNSAYGRVLKTLEKDLAPLCSHLGLKYPDDLHVVLQHRITPFDKRILSSRAENCLFSLVETYETNDVVLIAKKGGFQIGNLLKIKNCGVKSTVELIRAGIGIDTKENLMRPDRIKHTKHRPAARTEETFHEIDLLRKIHRRAPETIAKIKRSCEFHGFSYPEEINKLIRSKRNFFTQGSCSVRLSNVLKRELKRIGNTWSPAGFEALAQSGFFEISNLFKAPNVGLKTLTELLHLISPKEYEDEFTITDIPLCEKTAKSLFGLDIISENKTNIIDTFVHLLHAVITANENSTGLKKNIHSLLINEIPDATVAARSTWFLNRFSSLLSKLEQSRRCESGSHGLPSFSKQMLAEFRSLEILLLRARGDGYEELGKLYSLTRERIRQIHKKTQKAINENPLANEIISFLRPAVSDRSSAQNKIIRQLLRAFDDTLIVDNPSELSIQALKSFLVNQPHASAEEINRFMLDNGLDYFVNYKPVYSVLNVSISHYWSCVFLKCFGASTAAISTTDFYRMFPALSHVFVDKIIKRLLKHRNIQSLGRQGLYRLAPRETFANDDLTYAGFTVRKLKGEPSKIWTVRELLSAYGMETNTHPDARSFLGSIKASKVAEEAGIVIFLERFVFDRLTHPVLFEKVVGADFRSLIQSARRIDWNSIDKRHLGDKIELLSAKSGVDYELVRLFVHEYIVEYTSQTNQPRSIDVRGEFLQKLRGIAQANPLCEDPISLIYLEANRALSDGVLSFADCYDFLLILKEEGHWNE